MSIKKKLMIFVLAFFATICLLPYGVAYAQEIEDEIYIGGIRVTTENASAITGEGITGTVTYDPDTNTIYLTNATITGNYNDVAIRTYGMDEETLNIVFDDKCVIDVSSVANSCGIEHYGNIDFVPYDIDATLLLRVNGKLIETDRLGDITFDVLLTVVGSAKADAGVSEMTAVDIDWWGDLVVGDEEEALSIYMSHIHDFTATGVCSCGAVEISATTFPDVNFRAWISENITGTNDNILTTDELAAVTTITAQSKEIENLKGIEFFSELEQLDCYGNKLTNFDVSKNVKLIRLVCTKNSLGELDLSKNVALEELYCDYCTLTNLDVTNNVCLKKLNCNQNELDEIDISKNVLLQDFSCYGNNLTSLNVTKNRELTRLLCYMNEIESLDLSKNTKLEQLTCYDNQLTQLDVRNNLELGMLDCYENNLSKLDVSNNGKLTQLNCDRNHIVAIDLSNNVALKSFSAIFQTISIDIDQKTMSFDMKTLDSTFDGSKAAVGFGIGGSFNGTVLTVNENTSSLRVTHKSGFTDDEGTQITVQVNVTINNPHTHSYSKTTHECTCGATNHTYPDYCAEIERVSESLNEAITNLNTAIDGKATPADIEKAVNELTASYKEADEKLNKALQGQITANAGEITKLQTALTKAEKTLDDAIKQVAADLEEAKDDLQKQINDLTSGHATDIAELEKAISGLTTAYQTADSIMGGRLDALESADMTIKTSLKTLEDTLTAADETLSNTIKALEEKLDNAKAELEAAIAQVQKNLDDAKAELEAKNNEFAQKDSELKQRLEAQNDELNGKITVLIVILSIVGVVSIGSAAVIVITFVKKRKG